MISLHNEPKGFDIDRKLKKISYFKHVNSPPSKFHAKYPTQKFWPKLTFKIHLFKRNSLTAGKSPWHPLPSSVRNAKKS